MKLSTTILLCLSTATLLFMLCGLCGCGTASNVTGGCGTAGAISTGLNGPDVVALDTDHAYFGDESGHVWSVPKSGGATVKLATLTGADHILGVAVDANNVYCAAAQGHGLVGEGTAGSGQIVSIPKTGGSPTTLAGGLNGPAVLVADDQFLYWTELGTQNGSSLNRDGRLQRVAKTGGAVQRLTSGLATPGGLVLDGSLLYFGETGGIPGSAAGPAGVRSVPAAGGAVSNLLDGKPAYYMAADASFIYFVSANEGGLYRIPKAGGSFDKIYVSGSPFPEWVAVDGGKVYFITYDPSGVTGSLNVVDSSGGSPLTLKSGMLSPLWAALDSCAVYVPTDISGGTIERVLR